MIFRTCPEDIGGTTTFSHGIKVEIQAMPFHMECRLDPEIYHQVPLYKFFNHVRISIDDSPKS